MMATSSSFTFMLDKRTNNFFCVEIHVEKSSRSMSVSIKAKDEQAAVSLKKYIIDLLSVNELISE
jgi:hypothetical protein